MRTTRSTAGEETAPHAMDLWRRRTASVRLKMTRGSVSTQRHEATPTGNAREEKRIDVLAAHSVTDLEGDSHRRKE